MKVKGCKHYESKVMKMAGGGAVPNVYSKKVPKMDEIKTRKKSVPYMTTKNPDGSQQYVRGKKRSDKLKTLNKVSDTIQKEENDNWYTKVVPNRGKDAHEKALRKSEKLWDADRRIGDAFMDEWKRK